MVSRGFRWLAVFGLCALAAAALVSAAWGADGQPGSLYRNSYALLIGINEYQNVPKLEYAVNDVKALRDVLIKSYGFDAAKITVLTDAQATKDGITRALARVTGKARVEKQDRVLIYFSGHGQTVPTDDGGSKGFLIPVDAEVNLNDLSDPEPFLSTCFPMNAVWETLDLCPAKHVLLIADACYGGLLARTRDLSAQADVSAQVLAGRKARQVMTGGGKGEKTFEDPKWGHGAFTYKLLDELQSRAREPGAVFTTQELFASLQRSVSNLTKGKQTPQLADKDTEGEFLFTVPGGSQPDIAVTPAPRPAVATPPKPATAVVPPEQAEMSGSIPKTKINPKDGAEMILIPAGAFLMGSSESDAQASVDEKPQHTVYLDSYYIYKNLVTVAQYRQFCQETGRTMASVPSWGLIHDHPIVNVSWDDANAYAQWVGGSLPTEAQWEKAARGGDGRLYPWGNTWNGSKCQNNEQKTAPVGSFASGASPYGVLDMAGNVWQWCADWYGENYYSGSPSRNPTGPVSGSSRVLRGGNWGSDVNASSFGSAYRYIHDPSLRYFILFGFRCSLPAAGP